MTEKAQQRENGTIYNSREFEKIKFEIVMFNCNQFSRARLFSKMCTKKM